MRGIKHDAAGARRRLRAVDARPAVLQRRGRVGAAHRPPPEPATASLLPPRPVRATPVAIVHPRSRAAVARAVGHPIDAAAPSSATRPRVLRRAVREGRAVRSRDRRRSSMSLDRRCAEALAELVWAGLVASDGFAGLRSIWAGRNPAPAVQGPLARSRARRQPAAGGPIRPAVAGPSARADGTGATSAKLRSRRSARLLHRYGIMCRRLLAQRTVRGAVARAVAGLSPARGPRRVRGGRFVSGLAGEQFALPEAVELARQVRRTKPPGETITISAADPLEPVRHHHARRADPGGRIDADHFPRRRADDAAAGQPRRRSELIRAPAFSLSALPTSCVCRALQPRLACLAIAHAHRLPHLRTGVACPERRILARVLPLGNAEIGSARLRRTGRSAAS